MDTQPALPTESDLETLPYFAILALGARCARRVAPLFGAWDGATEEQVRAVSGASRAVADLASSPNTVARAPLWASATQAALLAADAASAADQHEAPSAALHAADAAAELADAIDPEGPRHTAARAVCRSVRASAGALEDAGGEHQGAFLVEVAQVLAQLRQHASSEGWTDTTSVTIQDA